MKSRRLTETDIVNLAFKPVETKLARLTNIERPKQIIGSYEPFRRSNADAVNLQLPLIAEAQDATSLEMLEAVVAKACKGNEDLLAMNLPIARSTHSFAMENKIVAFREDVRHLILPFGHAYEFGMPLLMAYPNGKIVAAFPDLRRTDPLTGIGRRTALSFMHQRWKENNPDLSRLGLQIWRYKNTVAREIEVFECSETDLFTYDEIIADVRQTYEIWHEVLASAAKGRRGETMGPGPLFGTA
ncbi:hypothetical protein [Erythrobacter sp.]|uniref:hypothetical protein n=1 Tax=Erythrobacter sp. TaxID=1042 RepID=UPI0025E66B17|nr:hypothetical protein [Erythrobacter sp.]